MDQTTKKEKNRLLRACFDAWRRVFKSKKERAEIVQRKLEQKEKLDNLMRALKKYKKVKQEQVMIKEVTVKETPSNFKNRFHAQKSTIEKLTLKLEAKDRLIEELKLGIFDKDAMKSLNETKIEIREIFANCSTKVRCKIPPPPDYSEQFMISTQKAPKIVQEMEEKAAERAKRRELILERKRILLETRQRTITEALERKRIQDEEEKKRNLEKILERRRREMETQKTRQINKIFFLQKLKKAMDLYKEKMLRRAFKKLAKNCKQGKHNNDQALLHYKIKMLCRVMRIWKLVAEEKYRDKNNLADAVFAKNILLRSLHTWHQMRIERMRSMQVAEDFHDLLLVNNTFVHWHRHVCIQIMLEEKKLKMAQKHCDRRVLFHCFYQWRSLPAVIQLERSKELKLKRWREKVWAILPDYKPPTEDGYF